LHAGGAEGKGEFTTLTVWQYGMVQFTQGKYLALHETKVVIDVGVTRLRDKLGMTFGVDERFVDPGVQERCNRCSGSFDLVPRDGRA